MIPHLQSDRVPNPDQTLVWLSEKRNEPDYPPAFPVCRHGFRVATRFGRSSDVRKIHSYSTFNSRSATSRLVDSDLSISRAGQIALTEGRAADSAGNIYFSDIMSSRS